jgi:Regulator of chromosome condensation (RCC1) repeat
MRTGRGMRAASGGVVVAVACAVYAWSVIGAFAHSNAGGAAFASAFQYQYSNGHVTGKGSILSGTVRFNFDAKADAKGLKAHCKITEDKTAKIHCVTIDSLVVVGTHATFSGTARHNGVETTFTIDVEDLADPGARHDRFAITSSDGYARSGVLNEGNVEIREKKPKPDHGAVVAWGCGQDYGQCDVPESAMGDVAAIAAGWAQSLVLKKDGTVVAWGCGSFGLDFGQCEVPDAAAAGVTALAAGAYHSLALREDGRVVAWGCGLGFGGGVAGQCGVPLAARAGVTAIAAGLWQSLAVTSDGGVVALGCGGPGLVDFGQCTVPAAAANGVVAVAAGFWHSLALKEDGSVVAWGCASPFDEGQCVVPFAALRGVTAIAAGDRQSLALRKDGSVVAWGCRLLDQGQCSVPAVAMSGVIAIAAGSGYSLALKKDGTVIEWGCGGVCNAPVEAQGARLIAAGYFHALAVKR